MYKWATLLCTWNTVSQLFHCCSLSHIRLCNPIDCSTPGLPDPHLPECAQTYVHWVNDAIQPSHPLLSPSPPAFNLSQNQVFPNEFTLCIRRPTYWSFSISPSNEYSGLISFRIDEFDLLTVHGTLRSLLQHHSSKASIFWCSAFFIVQVSHLYMTRFDHMDICQQSDVSAF